MEVNALIALAMLVIGPGSGVYIGLRAAQGTLEESNRRMEKTLERIVDELRTLNHRTTKSEAHIEGLEDREGR